MSTAPTQPATRSIEPNAIYTAQEAALLLAINPQSMQRKLESGAIKGSKKIGRWRVRGSELLKFA